MPRPTAITDIRAALLNRIFPTVMVWNRLEGRPRTTEFDRALQADIHDPLWMLSRQWQLGEFRGEDGGSPVTAMFHVQTTRPTRYQAQDSPPEDLPDGQPLETLVEGRAVPFTIGPSMISLDLRLAMGRRWMKLMSAMPPALRTRIMARWPVTEPDPASDATVPLAADAEVRATLQALAGRTVDGYELYQHLKAGGHPYDGVDGVTAQQEAQLDALAPRFIGWFDDLIAQPSGPEAFDPTRLEHRFSLAAPGTSGETVLSAPAFPGGRLDWHAFSYDTSGTTLGVASGTPASGAAAGVTRTVVPGEVRYRGMPSPRWWAFEDGQTDFGAVTPDTTDLVKTLFIEFALVYSNNWFLLPFDLDAGSLAQVDGVAFTDVFGQRTWIEPTGTGADDDWQRWSMYNLDVSGTGPAAARLGLFLPSSAAGAAQGPPVEDILMVRDEAANMVWGIEQTVWLATGSPQPGSEAARETLAYREQLQPPAAEPAPAAPITYQVSSTVPENWIPFIPVHVTGDNREIQLQRGAMPRILGGAVAKVQPRTTLLRPGLDAAQPYFVHEEEVPRVGARVTVAFNRTRRHDGRVLVWLGAWRATGRGEASSGLDWDRINDAPSGSTPPSADYLIALAELLQQRIDALINDHQPDQAAALVSTAVTTFRQYAALPGADVLRAAKDLGQLAGTLNQNGLYGSAVLAGQGEVDILAGFTPPADQLLGERYQLARARWLLVDYLINDQQRDQAAAQVPAVVAAYRDYVGLPGADVVTAGGDLGQLAGTLNQNGLYGPAVLAGQAEIDILAGNNPSADQVLDHGSLLERARYLLVSYLIAGHRLDEAAAQAPAAVAAFRDYAGLPHADRGEAARSLLQLGDELSSAGLVSEAAQANEAAAAITPG